MTLRVLHEDNHLLAVDKPAGIASAHADDHGDAIDRIAKDYLKAKYAKPGQVFLGIVHRLDKPTSGVLLFARTSKAAARLSEQFRDGAVRKAYWAIVEAVEGAEPTWKTGEAELDDWLWHDDAAHRVRVVRDGSTDAKRATTRATVLATEGSRRLLELRPATGRKHQLRVQLASRGWPIIGDRHYGSAESFGSAIALHARHLAFRHPTKDAEIAIEAPLPDQWRSRFGRLLNDAIG